MSPRLGCLALLSLTACGPRITYVEPPKASVTDAVVTSSARVACESVSAKA
jgi:hypothetical protein